jgi:hypothetical protein
MREAHRKIVTKALHLITQGWEMLEKVQDAKQNDFDRMMETDQKGSLGIEAQETIDALYSAVEALQNIQFDLGVYEDQPEHGVQIADEV